MLAAERAWHGCAMRVLVLVALLGAVDELDGDVRTVGFRQTWRGLPVIGGELGFVFAHDRLFAVSSHAVPNVHPAAGAGHAVLRDRLVDVEDRGEWTVYVDPATRAEL